MMRGHGVAHCFASWRIPTYAAAEIVPDLTPTRAEVAAEAALPQRDKEDGVEIDQGIFLAHMLARPRSGEHLCHAMLLPRPESEDLVAKFAAKGALDLGAARLTRKGKAVHLDMVNPRFLNAEDDTTWARRKSPSTSPRSIRLRILR